MPIDNAKNGARATLATGITAGATSIALTAGHGARMPSVPFNAWIYNATDHAADPHDDPGYEIVRVTARSTDTLTVSRAQESTAAAAHNTSGKTYRLIAGLTARTINQHLAGEYYNAKGYGLVGDGVTNDTAALQSLIDQLAALGGGKIYFPPGTYLISGPLQETSGRNAQILLPIVPTASAPVTIELIGALAPTTQFYVGSPLPPPTGYSIIKSTLTGGSGTAAFIGGIESGADLWNNVQLVVRDLVFQAPPNPSFTAFNCFDLMGSHFERVLIHTGSLDVNTIAEPTNSNAVGIKLAPSNHSTGSQLNVVNVYGFYVGMQDGELVETHANFVACNRGVVVPFTYHLSTYRHLGVFNCAHGIVAAGPGASGISGDDGTHYMRVFACAAERTNSSMGLGQAWQERVADLHDSGNLLKGDLKWLTVRAGVGNDHSFVKVGGTGITTTEIGA